jgi:predicted DNA-binding antitoxin AbrB/MazE fold protein
MTTTLDAVYTRGVLRLSGVLPLPENARVRVTIETDAALPAGADPERAAWLMRGEESLRNAWDNPDDEVFNELLAR